MIEETLRLGIIVSDDELKKDRVRVGSTVTVYDEEMEENEEYKIVGTIESDPDRGWISNEYPIGKALLNKGQVLNATGDIAGAQSAFELALANGQEKAAKRQLSNLFVKKAKAASGEKKYNDALAFAKQAISYDESEANAYYLGGIAAQALNKNSEAIELFEKYLVLKPSASNSQAVRQVVEALKKAAK